MGCTSARAGERSSPLWIRPCLELLYEWFGPGLQSELFTGWCRGVLATVRATLPSWLGGTRST